MKKINFINGKEDGLYKEYYENGQTKNICFFINGNIEGISYGYYENEKLKYENNFKNCMYHGSIKKMKN